MAVHLRHPFPRPLIERSEQVKPEPGAYGQHVRDHCRAASFERLAVAVAARPQAPVTAHLRTDVREGA
jgi:hypothetical protein